MVSEEVYNVVMENKDVCNLYFSLVNPFQIVLKGGSTSTSNLKLEIDNSQQKTSRKSCIEFTPFKHQKIKSCPTKFPE